MGSSLVVLIVSIVTMNVGIKALGLVKRVKIWLRKRAISAKAV